MPDPNFSLANLNQKMRENDMRFEYDSASKSKQAELPEGEDAYLGNFGERQDVFMTPP